MLYGAIADFRYRSPYCVSLKGKKIIAVGGITVGGSGKTEVVRSICRMLQEKHKKVAVLSRGYGRVASENMKVDAAVHTYRDVGDEPLLLSCEFPVFVGKNRAQTAEMATEFEYLVLDDGMTQKYLKPTKKIIVVSDSQKFGNGELLPLGPNRLNFDTIKSDVDAVVVIGDGGDKFDMNIRGNIPVFYGKIRQNFRHLSGRLIVFCGLGYPQKFFKIFSNFEVAKTITFPDHYPYKDEDMEKLLAEAFRLKAQLVTTEKDFMRIPDRYKSRIQTVGIDIAWKTPINSLLEL